MPRFERSRGRGSSRDSRPKRGGRSRGSFEDRPRERGDSGRSSRPGRGRRDLEMTKVICSACGVECEVPFKPTSSKPVYCRDCFAKKGKGSSDKHSDRSSDRDLDLINEKLNKIMKALKIE